eukprot:scaffold304_cov216-Alexandrium_tamarense.AAC.14
MQIVLPSPFISNEGEVIKRVSSYKAVMQSSNTIKASWRWSSFVKRFSEFMELSSCLEMLTRHT